LTIEIRLAPDQEAFLLQRVRSGRFATADEAVREAVSLLRKQEEVKPDSSAKGKKSLAQLLAESPFQALEVDFPRDKSPMRPINL
jgi:putative addiction module CopG family antidote